MKRVLITGATGFIGRHCLDVLLKSGFEVYAISSRTVPAMPTKVSWYEVDLHDHLAIKELLTTLRPSYLLHSAWHIKLGDHWSSEGNLRWVNSSLYLAEEFINHGGKKLIGLGTCAEYDWSEKACSAMIDEELTPLKPNTVYGASKASLFLMLKSLCEAKNIGFVWARPFGPYGFFDNPKRLIPNTVLSLLKNEVMICNHSDFVRNFTFVEDIAQILVELLDNQTFGAINIANGQAVRLSYVINFIAKLLNAEKLVEFKTNPIMSNEPSLLIADVTKLKNELSCIAPTSIEEGLEKTVNWWQKKIDVSKKTIVSI